MLTGLRRVSALSGSLLLNLEAPFTILLAVLFFREHLGRLAALAALAIVGGGALLGYQEGVLSGTPGGFLLIAAACLCWGLDNNFTQRLALKDPFAIVRVKAGVAALTNISLALALGGFELPAWPVVAAALGLGALSYGASIVLDAYALRVIGAGREAAVFASAPFVGAVVSVTILGETLAWAQVSGVVCMVLGVALLLFEQHSHPHTHELLEHEHAHRHDEHHQHAHSPDDPPGAPHSHVHRHEPLVHAHPHLPDAHHRHRH